MIIIIYTYLLAIKRVWSQRGLFETLCEKVSQAESRDNDTDNAPNASLLRICFARTIGAAMSLNRSQCGGCSTEYDTPAAI